MNTLASSPSEFWLEFKDKVIFLSAHVKIKDTRFDRQNQTIYVTKGNLPAVKKIHKLRLATPTI